MPTQPPANTPSAPNPIGNSPAGGTFDFSNFGKQLDEQNKLTVARQAEELRVAQEVAKIKTKSAALAGQESSSMGFLLKDIQTSQAKAAHARALADSPNPIDTLRLIGLQHLDPNGYLRKQREERLTEDSQQAALLSSVFAKGQDALQAQLLSSTGQLDVYKTLEAIGNEKLTLYTKNAALAHENFAAIQTMKEDAIYGLDENGIKLAIGQAKASPNGTTNVGGVDVDVRTLEDRQTQLSERSYNALVKDTARQLATDENQHVGDTLLARENERAAQREVAATQATDFALRRMERSNQGLALGVQAAGLADDAAHITTDLAIKNAQRTSQAAAVVAQAQDRDLQHMTKTELQQLRDSNYTTPGGEKYIPEAVEKAYSIRAQAEGAAIDEKVRAQQLANFDMEDLATEKQRVDAMVPRFKEGTPIAKAVKSYQSALGVAALGAGESNGIVTRIAAIGGYQSAKADFEKALQAQATLDAKGDKNLEDMYYSYYRGLPIPQEAMTNAVTERLIKYKSVADIFPPEIAQQVERRYRDSISTKLQGSLLGGAPSAEDKRLMQAEAAQEAINYGVNQGLAGQTDGYLAGQVLDPTHPLYGKMTPQQIGADLLQADMQAQAEWQSSNQLSDAEVGSIMKGVDTPNRDTASLQQDLQFRQNSKFLQIIDARDPGIGHAVADWWTTHGANYISTAAAQLTAKSQGTFQGGNFITNANNVVGDQFAAYGAMMSQADAAYNQQLAQRNADMLMFGQNPESMQVAVLSYDKNMTDIEREQIFTSVIRPLIDEAKKQGLGFEDTNKFIEIGIQNFQPQTPEMKSLMKTVRRDRPDVLQSLNDWRPIVRSLFPFGFSGAADAVNTNWYQKWKAKNNQDSTPAGPSKDITLPGGGRIVQPGPDHPDVYPGNADNFITLGSLFGRKG